MPKKKVSLNDLVQQRQVVCDQMNELVDICERESREFTDAERNQYNALRRESDILLMRMQAFNAPEVATNNRTATEQVREIVRGATPGARVTIMLREDLTPMTTAGLADTGVIPVAQQEMIKPLRAGLIYDKVGINVRAGLTAGQLRWPSHSKAAAYFVDEGERVANQNIDFDKLTLTPRRLSAAVAVTNEELESSQGVVEAVIREELPAAVIDLINECMFCTSATYTPAGGSVAVTRKVYGPFVDAATNNKVTFAGDVPTRKELLKMKAKVLGTGITPVAPCWVMTEDMKAELEDVKVDAGSGRFVCENDKILGYPVFTTPHIGAGNVGFGDWSYQAAGFFGPINVTLDPYTLLRQNAADFVLNAHFNTVTLYKEAFVLGAKA